MRHASRAIFLGCFGLLLAAAPFQAVSQLPVAYWNLDELAPPPNVDSVGMVAATWTGGVTRSTTIPGTAFSYGNTSSLSFTTAAAPDYATLGAGTSLGALQVNSYSIACWFRPASTPPAGTRYALVMKPGDNEGLSLRQEGVFEFTHWTSDFANLTDPATWSYPAVAPNTWYHVVGAWDGTANRAYIFLNGVQADTRQPAAGSGGAALGATWYLGMGNPGAAAAADRWQADGILDDVRFYNFTFNANQAMVLAAGAPAPTALTSTVAGGTVTLTWTAPPQAVTYTYNIGRRVAGSGAAYTIVNGAPVSGTTTTDAPGATGNYEYVVYAISVATSGPSALSTANVMTTTPPVTPPVTPPTPSGPKPDSGKSDHPCGCGTASLPESGTIALGLAFLLISLAFRK